MTDEESPTESEPTQAAPVASEPTQATSPEIVTEVIPQGKPWWRRPGVVGLLAGGVALITALTLVVVLVVLPDGSQQAEEQVFLTPLDDPGADPFTDASMATPLDPTMTTPGPDPAGAPPGDPNATRTVYGDTDGLFGGTRNESTCDGQGLINYLQQQPAKAAAWASVQKISVDQIPGYIQQLTPVRLRADTRVLDHGFVNGQAYSRQAVLQALTAVMVDKYGMPRVRCMSGSPLLDIPEVQQIQQQQAQPGQQAQPVRRAVARRPVFIGTQWRGFNPRVIVVILRPLRNRIIDFIILLDLRRLPIILLFGRRIGIRLGIAGVDLRVFDVDLVVARPRAVVVPAPQAPPPLAPPPIQAAPPVQAPPPVQGPPRGQPPVQAQPPVQGSPGGQPPVVGLPPVVAQPPVVQAPPAFPPIPAINSVFPPLGPEVLLPPIMGPVHPPVIAGPMGPGVHQPPAIVPQAPAIAGPMGPEGHPPPVPVSPPVIQQPVSPPVIQSPSGSTSGGIEGDPVVPQVPSGSGSGTGSGSSNSGTFPGTPAVPEDPSGTGSGSGSGSTNSGTFPGTPAVPQVPSGTGSGSGTESGSGSGTYQEPNYGSLPGAGSGSGDPGGNLQCDPILNPC
jgi:hypothetical protein